MIVPLLLFTLGQVGRFSYVYLYEIAALTFFSFLLYKYSYKPITEQYKKIPSLFYFLGTLFVSFIISIPFHSSVENGIAVLYLVRLSFYWILFCYLYHYVKAEKVSFHILLLITTVIIMVGGVVQYFLYPDLRNLFYLGWDPHLNRVFGSFFEPVIYGSVLGLLLIYFWKNYTIAIPGILLLFLTYSRGIYLGFLSMLFIYFLKNNIKNMIYVIVLFAVMILLLPKSVGEGVNLSRTSTIESRLEDYKTGIELWKKNPIVGIGYNHIRSEKMQDEDNHAGASFHSSFLIVLVTGGILSLFTFIGALYQIALLNMFARLSVIFLSIVSLFDNVLLHPFVLFIFVVCLAQTLSRPSGT